MNKRFRQLKNILLYESEAEKEIRSNLEDRIMRNSARIFEHKHQS